MFGILLPKDKITETHWILSYISDFGLWAALKQVEPVGPAAVIHSE